MFPREPLKDPPVWADAIERDNARFLSVSSNDESNITNNSEISDPIDLLPIEIFYMIIERLDAESFVNCMHVSKKWQTAVFCFADGDKTNQTWHTILKLYHEEDTFNTKTCGLPYKDQFANFLLWNLDFSISSYGACWLNHIKKVTIYRDNIVVLHFEGVKYFDVVKHNIKKSLLIRQCLDFEEYDSFVLRMTELVLVDEVTTKLFLFGKSSIYDDSYDSVMETQLEVYGPMHFGCVLITCDVAHYTIEKNRCYVMNSKNNALTLYTWLDQQWVVSNMGRYYGNQNDNLYAMNVLNRDILLLTKWGQLIAYSYEKRNFQEVHRFRFPSKRNVFVKMVHKYCLVIGVAIENEFRITRIRNNEGYYHYKFECPNLSCATQHGDMLFLGYNDGKIEIFSPRAAARKDMFRRRLHLTDFTSEPVELHDRIISSIDVYEDFERHFVFVSTQSAVHHLVIEHTNATRVWDNIPMRQVYYKFPIRTRYPM